MDAIRPLLNKGLTAVFLILVLGTTIALMQLNQPIEAQTLYLLFALTLVIAKLAPREQISIPCLIISASTIVLTGLIFPVDMELLEEIYMIIPLLFLIIRPGELWPISLGILLVTAYIPSIAQTELSDFIEDAVELLLITGFATIMTYFQQRSMKQMQQYRADSFTDYLTGLPNRKSFMEKLGEQKRLTDRKGRKHRSGFALMIFDLDGFKRINDQFGHFAGDRLLKTIAVRLTKQGSKQCEFFRIGGDEFACIVTGSDTPRDLASDIADQLLKTVNQPYRLKTEWYQVSASIGISVYPSETENIEGLCSNADQAMYRAKQKGKNRVEFYDNELMIQTHRKYELENALHYAIDRNQLSLYFQPKVCLRTTKVVSGEALLRWHHPSLGTIPPAEFIAIAEENRSIIPIGHWVIEKACESVVRWKSCYKIERLAVNVSPVQLTDPDFVTSLEKILQRTGCKPEWLEIEQTESWLMENPEDNVKIVNEIKALGVQLSMDDFGKAYSSLSQIGRLPLDTIKIDKSFIQNSLENERDHMIVRTIIQLGHNLKMNIVAEGVETEEQRELLRQELCCQYQGYLFSQPVPESVFTSFLEQRTQGVPQVIKATLRD